MRSEMPRGPVGRLPGGPSRWAPGVERDSRCVVALPLASRLGFREGSSGVTQGWGFDGGMKGRGPGSLEGLQESGHSNGSQLHWAAWQRKQRH